jgi:hypothetical protein
MSSAAAAVLPSRWYLSSVATSFDELGILAGHEQAVPGRAGGHHHPATAADMIEGLLEALSPSNLLLMVLGVAGGVIVGCLPGLTATMGLALLTPSTFATSLDGFPMTEQGRGREALIAACFSSAIGALIGGLALLLLSPPLAWFSLRFGPPEFFWLGVLALTIMGSLVGDSFLRGVSGGLFGLLLSTVGVATTGGATRFTFGFYQLTGGISLPVALIGLFAIPQLINLVQNRGDDGRIARLDPARGPAQGAARRQPAREPHPLERAWHRHRHPARRGLADRRDHLLQRGDALVQGQGVVRQGQHRGRHRVGDRQQRRRTSVDGATAHARHPRLIAECGDPGRASAPWTAAGRGPLPRQP